MVSRHVAIIFDACASAPMMPPIDHRLLMLPESFLDSACISGVALTSEQYHAMNELLYVEMLNDVAILLAEQVAGHVIVCRLR